MGPGGEQGSWGRNKIPKLEGMGQETPGLSGTYHSLLAAFKILPFSFLQFEYNVSQWLWGSAHKVLPGFSKDPSQLPHAANQKQLSGSRQESMQSNPLQGETESSGVFACFLS